MSELKEITGKVLHFLDVDFEEKSQSIEALIPENLQKNWEVPEFIRFDFETESPDGCFVSLESEWTEKFLFSLKNKGKQVGTQIETEVPRKILELEKMISKEVHFTNATYRVKSVTPSSTFYSTFLLHITATSDDKREDIISATFNEANQFHSRQFSNFFYNPLHFSRYENLNSEERTRSTNLQKEIVSKRFEFLSYKTMEHFLKAMERRVSRDRDRLWQYYTDMQNQILQKASGKYKKNKSTDLTIEKSKLKAIESEYFSKVNELERKYKLVLEYDILQTICTKVPVYRAEVTLHRRKDTRLINLDYNLFTKKLDSFYCENCGADDKNYSLEDSSLRILCPKCTK